MEQLLRWREPVAVVLLVASGIRLLIGITAVPVLAAEGAYDSFASAARFEAGRTFDVVLIVVTAVVAASCLRTPATPRARAVVTVAAIETLAAVLVALGFGLMGLVSDANGRVIEFAHLLLGLVLPVVAVISLLLLRRSSAPMPRAAGAVPAVGTGPAAEPTAPGAALPGGQTQPAPLQPAAWQPEQATGRVWTTAGEAARGAPGASWGEDPGPSGWRPIPGPGEPPPPEPR